MAVLLSLYLFFQVDNEVEIEFFTAKAVFMGKEIIDLGTVVRQHRKTAGLSQLELAELAGVGKTSVFDVEKGKQTVRLNTLLRILSALNISIELSSPLLNRENGYE